MKSFFGNAIVKKTISFILVLTIVAGVAFAAPLKAQNGFGDAKVYDSSYKAVKDPAEVSDKYVVKTSSSAVTLYGDSVSVEIEGNTLLQFISLGDKAVFYLLDGKAAFSSDAAFEVNTPVTSYKAQPGTSIYVITEDAEETAYVNKGQAEATNIITRETTTIGEGTSLDNTSKEAKLSSTTKDEYWSAKSPAEEQAAEPEQSSQEPVVVPVETTEAAVVEQTVVEITVTGTEALEHTFLYRGIRAVLTAYIGVAELEYPDYVTNEEIDSAARAAVLSFPETLTKEITYEVMKPGLVQIYYPETYGKTEFEMAVNLIEQELPGYIDAILGTPGSEEQIVAEVPASQAEPAATPEQTAAAETPAEAPQAAVSETIVSKTEKPAAQEEEPAPAEEPAPEEETKSLKFGGTIGFIYGHGDRGDYFADPQFIHERAGVFLKNYMAIVDPVLSYGHLKFGLHLVVDIRSGELVNPLKRFVGNGITGVVSGLMQFVSVFSYEKGNFSFKVDRTSESVFTSPISDKLSRNYDNYNKLTATMNYNNGNFGFTAFVDDLELNAKIAGHSQFAGAKMTYLLGKMTIGMGVIADFGNGLKKTVFYPGGDASLPFTIKDVGFELYGGAVAAFPADKTQGKAAMVEGMLNKTSGILTFGAGIAYSVRYNFNDIVNNGPTSVISAGKGKSLDVKANIGVNTEHFKLSADITAPLALGGDSRLVHNTVLTKYGNTATITSDTMNFQADVIFGKFSFTAGVAFNGFAGRVVDLARALRNSEDRRAALAGLIDPEVSTYFAKAQFAPEIGSTTLAVYVRADVMTVKSKIAVPFSAGVSFSF